MKTRRSTALFAVCATVWLVGTSGCSPKLAPSEEGILWYARNARLFHFRTGVAEGQVRRLWPAGQEYVNQLLKVDATFQATLLEMRRFETSLSLAPKADSFWRDSDKIASEIESLAKSVETDSEQRTVLLDELKSAIYVVPPDLNLAGAAKDAFIDRVWQALAVDDFDLRSGEVVQRLEETGSARLKLLRTVSKHSAKLDGAGVGLSFTDPAIQAEVDGLYDSLSELLEAREAEFAAWATEQLKGMQGRLAEIDKREDRDEYTYLSNKRAYLRDELHSFSKERFALVKKLESSVGSVDDPTAADASDETAYIVSRIKKLKEEAESWKLRVDELVKKTDPKADQSD